MLTEHRALRKSGIAAAGAPIIVRGLHFRATLLRQLATHRVDP